MKQVILLALIVAGCAGCSTQREWYKSQGWTPDSFNYTISRDHKTGELVDYFGASWSLK